MDCRKCGKKGHIERACRNKNTQTRKQHHVKKKSGPHKNIKKHVHKMEHEHEEDSDSEDEEEVHVLSLDDDEDDGYWITVLLENTPVRMQVDTGTRVSLISEKVYKTKLKHLALNETKLKLRTYTGDPVSVVGMINVTVKYQTQTSTLPLYVVAGDRPALLGRRWLKKIRLNWQEVFVIRERGAEPLQEILKKYPKVFDGKLGSMKDIMVKLAVKPGSTPKCLKARPVPYAIKTKVEAELDRLVENGVLEPVRTSEWATPIVPIMKKDGTPRICGDFKVTVNPVLITEQYPLPLIDDLFSGLAGGQKFSKIDLSQAYLQMHVDPESQELLTIVTHKGLYRHKRLPFGITSAPALFQRAMDHILSGLTGVQCYLDDLLITGPDERTHLKNLDAVFQRLENYGLKVQKDKCEFFKSSVEYLGHVIDSKGLHKAPSKVKAITEAPAPKNVSQLRSFLGLLTYYARFVPNLAHKLKPLHELLNKTTPWKWTENCEKAFNQVKLDLTKSEALVHFDSKLPLQLACDASPYGLGAVVSHILPSGEERPIAFASRTLSKSESNYAQIEREALSIVFGVKKFHQYLFGRKFILLTDHKPLTTIFGPHKGIPSLAASRMQRWALLLSAHQYEIKYRKSDEHQNADGLSRLPLPETQTESSPTEILFFKTVSSAPVTAAHVKKHTRTDPTMSEVLDIVTSGKRGEMTPSLKPYLVRQNELSVQGGCLLWGFRVIIPSHLREKVLTELHTGHCGVVRMKEIARSYFWWPGLDADIERKAMSCSDCQKLRNQRQLAPLHPWDWPEEPWQRIHVDFAGPFENQMFLVVVDAHSKWPEVVVMKNTSAERTVEELRTIFSRFGLPQQLVSDNGPQFVSEVFNTFMEENG
uniref:Gypsy retrotransposon integrase-like protein 1 n=1 Tax=Oryzias melastigma TaxID=30732 RepID=A0A3B3C7M6_ORYME